MVCVSYFSVAVIKQPDQKQLKGEFILVYGSRWLESVLAGKTCKLKAEAGS